MPDLVGSAIVRVVMEPSPIPSTTDLTASLAQFYEGTTHSGVTQGVTEHRVSPPTYLPSAVVSIPLRSAWTLKLAIIVPSFLLKALIVFLPLW